MSIYDEKHIYVFDNVLTVFIRKGTISLKRSSHPLVEPAISFSI